MFAAVVSIHVKPEFVEAFIEATLDNAQNSIQEPGVARFDFAQSQDDRTQFILYEIYRAPDAQLAHRETAHYLRWRDAVTDMMVTPRTATKYDLIHPAGDDDADGI